MNSRVNENAINMMDKVEDDEEDDGVTIEAQRRKSDAFIARMMAMLAEMTGAADTEKRIKETTEKEKERRKRGSEQERERKKRGIVQEKERERKKRGIVLERRKRIERGISKNFI